MGEVEAKKDRVKRHALRHDRHTVSMLTDYPVFFAKISRECFARRGGGGSGRNHDLYGEEAINAIAEIVEHNVVSGVREYGLDAIKRIKEGKIKGGVGEK